MTDEQPRPIPVDILRVRTERDGTLTQWRIATAVSLGDADFILNALNTCYHIPRTTFTQAGPSLSEAILQIFLSTDEEEQ